MTVMRLTVPATTKKKRLDDWLVSELRRLSRSHAKRLLKKGAITVNGEVQHQQEYELADGDVVEIDWLKPSTLRPVPIDLDVLYEDQQVVVINKPAGIVVHPSIGHPSRTVINALLARYPNIKPYSRGWPRLVHRLDRDTSGVLVVARSLTAVDFLQKQFSERTTEKEYLALVLGHPERAHGTIEGPIGRHETHWRKWAVVPNGRPATTHYELLQSFANSSLLLVRPITGRTHQIRVHLQAIALPIAGDWLYGPRRHHIRQLSRQFLHAARLTITTPDGQRRTFYAPLPEELQAVLRDLREQSHFPSSSSEVEPIHKIPFFPWEVEPIPKTPSHPSEVEPIPKKTSLIELLSSFEEIEGFEAIELTEGFEGFEEFEEFEEFEDEEFEDEEFEEFE